jgi:hypothetical protein
MLKNRSALLINLPVNRHYPLFYVYGYQSKLATEYVAVSQISPLFVRAASHLK